MAIGTGLLFGLFPALHSTRPDLVSTLKGQAGQPSGARGAARFRTSLVTAQIALSMALLVSAGLFIKSLVNVSRVDLGLKTDDVVTFGLSPQLNGYDEVRLHAFFERVEDELAAVPGVTGVSDVHGAAARGQQLGQRRARRGVQGGAGHRHQLALQRGRPGLLPHARDAAARRGASSPRADAAGAPKVVVVNEAFAKKFNLGRDAVGKHMSTTAKTNLDIEIVGLVRNAKYSDVKRKVPPVFFRPYRQDDRVGTMSLLRAHGAPARRDAEGDSRRDREARSEPAGREPEDDAAAGEGERLPRPDDQHARRRRSRCSRRCSRRSASTACSPTPSRSARARSACGWRSAPTAARVRGMVLRQVGWMTLVGGGIGVAAALALGRSRSSLLFELKGYDPIVIVVRAAALALVALGAGFVPALRASRVEPMQALRYE